MQTGNIINQRQADACSGFRSCIFKTMEWQHCLMNLFILDARATVFNLQRHGLTFPS